jgi:hypothetical protein
MPFVNAKKAAHFDYIGPFPDENHIKLYSWIVKPRARR